MFFITAQSANYYFSNSQYLPPFTSNWGCFLKVYGITVISSLLGLSVCFVCTLLVFPTLSWMPLQKKLRKMCDSGCQCLLAVQRILIEASPNEIKERKRLLQAADVLDMHADRLEASFAALQAPLKFVKYDKRWLFNGSGLRTEQLAANAQVCSLTLAAWIHALAFRIRHVANQPKSDFVTCDFVLSRIWRPEKQDGNYDYSQETLRGVSDANAYYAQDFVDTLGILASIWRESY